MPDASSSYLNQPVRERREFLEQRMREGVATTEEYREWLAIEKEPFREARKEKPLLTGTAAIGAGYVLGLETFHKAMLAKQARR